MIKITPYQAPLWARNGYLNTFWGATRVQSFPRPRGESVLIPFSDGSKTEGLWIQGDSNWVVIGSHGLGGSLDSDFCLRMPALVRDYGHSILVVNHRNAGSSVGLSATTYNSGRGDDMSDYISYVRKRMPQSKILVMAYSLGASMLLNLLTGRRGEDLPEFAVAINPPLDLELSSNRLSRGRALAFGQSFVGDLRQTAEDLIEQKIISEKYRIPKWATLRTVDEVFTAPLSGYSSAHDYYHQCSVGPYLKDIKSKALIVAALDDPMIDFSLLKKMEMNKEFPAHVQIHLEPFGGHIGFVTGTWSDLRNKACGKWTSQLITDVITQVCD